LHQSWNRPFVDWAESDTNHRWSRLIYSLFCATCLLTGSEASRSLFHSRKAWFICCQLSFLVNYGLNCPYFFLINLGFMSFFFVEIWVSYPYFSINLSSMVSACISLWDQSKISRARQLM
jgi:hypothetical protein